MFSFIPRTLDAASINQKYKNYKKHQFKRQQELHMVKYKYKWRILLLGIKSHNEKINTISESESATYNR